MDKCLVFGGKAHPGLNREITDYLGKEPGRVRIDHFKDGETLVALEENVRGRDIFVIQPTCPPVNENLMELLILIDALKRSSAGRITAVIPYFGYARQDRKDRPRVPITSKLVANLITASGAGRVMAMDLHAAQIQGFFDIPVDHLYAAPVTISYFQALGLSRPVVVSPDVGSVKMARSYAKNLNAELAIVDKRREGPDKVEAINLIGRVKGKNAILVDDMVSTANTLLEAAAVLRDNGARKIYAACTHAILAQDAPARIQASAIEELVVTNTVPMDPSKAFPKLKVLSVAHLLGEAIKRIHLNESVSSLFI